MKKNKNITIRIEEETGKKVERLLGLLGITMSVAVRMYLKRIEREGNLNFMLGAPPVGKDKGPVKGNVSREQAESSYNKYIKGLDTWDEETTEQANEEEL